jgi:hypothetical protein
LADSNGNLQNDVGSNASLNLLIKSLAEDIGVSNPTIKNWLGFHVEEFARKS